MLSLYVNAARVGSTRLSALFNACGVKTYNEPFNIGKLRKRADKGFLGDKNIILKYSDLKLSDLENYDTNGKNFKDLTFYKKILDAYALSPSFYFIGIQRFSFSPAQAAFFCGIYPCLFLQRRNIDVYISRMKARITQNYAGENTTNLKPKADAEDFYNYTMRQIFFYNSCYYSAMNAHRKVSIINYEDWGNVNDQDQLSVIKNFILKNKTTFYKLNSKKNEDNKNHDFIRFTSEFIDTKGKNEPALTKLKRQDHNSSWENKISNSSEFIEQCQKLGIEKLINKSTIDIH